MQILTHTQFIMKVTRNDKSGVDVTPSWTIPVYTPVPVLVAVAVRWHVA